MTVLLFFSFDWKHPGETPQHINILGKRQAHNKYRLPAVTPMEQPLDGALYQGIFFAYFLEKQI